MKSTMLAPKTDTHEERYSSDLRPMYRTKINGSWTPWLYKNPVVDIEPEKKPSGMLSIVTNLKGTAYAGGITNIDLLYLKSHPEELTEELWNRVKEIFAYDPTKYVPLMNIVETLLTQDMHAEEEAYKQKLALVSAQMFKKTLFKQGDMVIFPCKSKHSMTRYGNNFIHVHSMTRKYPESKTFECPVCGEAVDSKLVRKLFPK